MEEYQAHCKYCGNSQTWKFEPDNDFSSMDEIIKYDYEYSCNSCGSNVRVSEALDTEVLAQIAY